MRWAIALLIGAVPAAADVSCRNSSFQSNDYAICAVTANAPLALYHSADDGTFLGSFDALEGNFPGKLVFAMNAGMYHDDRSPVGLFQRNGTAVSSLVTRTGPGNFGLLPNGVFCIRQDGSYAVIETLKYAEATPDCRDANQSGPMLVIDGALHPSFIPGGTSRRIRNGVGVAADGQTAFFAISDTPVNFYDLALLFRDHLGLEQALYLDGNISRLYAPELGRNDAGFALGPMVAVIDPAGQ